MAKGATKPGPPGATRQGPDSATRPGSTRRHLASLVEDFRGHGSGVALVRYQGVRRFPTTYLELAVLAGRFAAELDRRGIGPGERVVLWGENSAEWVACFFGCVLRGVLAVPLDAAGSAKFAARVIRDVRPPLVVGDGTLLKSLQGGGAGDADLVAFRDLATGLPGKPMFGASPGMGEDTPLQIVFTSGTTSEPKGVVHTHGNVLASLRPIEAEMAKYRRYERWVHPLRFLHTLPFSHVFGQFMGLWIPPLLGAEVHLESRLEAGRLIELSRRERISVLVAVPRVLELLRTHLLARDPELGGRLQVAAGLPLWKRWWRLRDVHRAFGWKFWACICGGTTLPGDLEGFWNGLGYALIQGYGMTETAALVTLNHPFRVARGTLGRALPGREVKLEDGEILVRGEMLARATWQGGEMRPRESEWLHTGDLAEQGADGELRFVGRRGDVIVTSAGLNVYPADLERALGSQPGVRSAVVVAYAGPHGSEPAAALLFDGNEAELSDAVRNANRGLADFQQVRRFVRWPGLGFPYTSTGKLLRREIAAHVEGVLSPASTAAGGAATREATDPLLAAIAEITREPVATRDDGARLAEDFRLDSLGRVQLQSLLQERFGLELADDALSKAETLGDLRGLVMAERVEAVDGRGQPGPEIPEERVRAGDAAEPGGSPRRLAQTPGARSDDPYRYLRWPWSWPVRLLRVAFVEAVVRPLVFLLAAPRVVQDAELPDGPLLIVANHVTTFDLPLILHALPRRQRQRLAVAMSGEVLEEFRRARRPGSAFLRPLDLLAYWLLTVLFNVFPLPRLQGFRRSFAHAGAALDRGYSVLLFPEGRRSWSETMAAFRPGIGVLAQAAGVPVLPVALRGAATDAGTPRWFRSERLRVHLGTPLRVDQNGDAMVCEDEDPSNVAERLASAVRSLT